MAGYIGQIPTPQATQTRESFTATASQTSFATAGYTAGFVDVYLNGVHLLNGTDYTATNGSDIVLTTGAAAGDVLEVISYSTFEVNSQNFTGTTTTEALTVTGAFTSLGIDDNASSTAVTIDASGNLLVGTTDTSIHTSSSDTGIALRDTGSIYATRDGGTTSILNRLTSDGDILSFRKDGATVGSIGTVASALYLANSDTGLQFYGGGATDQIVPANGSGATRDNAIDLGKITGRFKDLYLSGGVYLGGTGAANLLDDYEEGTFTPVFQRSGTQPSVTYTGQEGYYTKVGDTVFVSIRMGVSSWSGGSGGAFRVAGLPFAVASGGGAYYSQATSIDNSYINLSAGYTTFGGYFSSGTTHIDMLAAGSGLTSSTSAVTPQSAFAVYYSGHYRTTA